MSVAKILCTTDFSAGADRALSVAVRIARDRRAELVVAHAWYVPAVALTLDAPLAPELMEHVIVDAEGALDTAVRAAAAAGATNVTGALLRGLPWMQIVEELETKAYDLCVIGTQGRSGVSRVLLGSVAEKVVRHAPCPVLVIRPGTEPSPFRHVLVPTDFSSSATQVLALASDLVAPKGRITLIHVIDQVIIPGMTVGETVRSLERSSSQALSREAAAFREMRSISGETRFGEIGAEILRVLDLDPTFDLVVTGSHGRTGIRRALMGSIAEKIVRYAHCPVAVARTPHRA